MTPTLEEWQRLSKKVEKLGNFVDKLKNLQWIVALLVAVFGINAATTWKYLSEARSESAALRDSVATLAKDVGQSEQRMREAQASLARYVDSLRARAVDSLTRHASVLSVELASHAIERLDIAAEQISFGSRDCALVEGGRTNVSGNNSEVAFGRRLEVGTECWYYKRLKLVSK